MFLRQGVNAFRSLGFPRVRGDVPLGLRRVQKTPKFSPRARGCSPGRYPNHRGFFVFPAYAGMFLGVEIVVIFLGSFPRVRGDVPCCQVTRVSPLWFSPRARGCSAGWCSRHACRDVFPAHAGMFLSRRMVASAGPSFSPRARGCSWTPAPWILVSLVFPACAGMFPAPGNRSNPGECFPHVRGDVPASGLSPMVARWFSPRARGCSGIGAVADGGQVVFPAYAGMFCFAARACCALPSFPRVRGDVPGHKTDTLFVGEFSPQARRSSTTKNREFFYWGILPAQTGTFR